MKKKILKGVSIIEVLVAISIIGILVSVSVSGFFYYKSGNSLNISTEQAANSIRRAQSKSMAIHGDSAWGVSISDKQAIVFKGTDFASRDSSFDESVSLSGIASVSGKTQFIFQKLSGIPQNSGSVTLDNGTISKTIQVNEKGIVTF